MRQYSPAPISPRSRNHHPGANPQLAQALALYQVRGAKLRECLDRIEADPWNPKVVHPAIDEMMLEDDPAYTACPK